MTIYLIKLTIWRLNHYNVILSKLINTCVDVFICKFYFMLMNSTIQCMYTLASFINDGYWEGNHKMNVDNKCKIKLNEIEIKNANKCWNCSELVLGKKQTTSIALFLNKIQV